MKTSNVILSTTLLGSIILFIAAGTLKINENNFLDYSIADPHGWDLYIETELDVIASKELMDQEISFESVFGNFEEEDICPEDIMDLQEEETIVF